MSGQLTPPRLPALALPAGLGGSLRPEITIPLFGVGAAVVGGAATALSPLAGVAVLLAVVFGLAVMARPALAGILLVGLVPAVSGLRRGLAVPGLRPGEVLILGLGLVALLAVPKGQANRWRAFDWIALLYVVTTLAVGGYDVLRQHQSFGGDAVGTLVGPLQFLILYRAVLVTLRTPEHWRAALRLLLAVSTLVAISTTLQQLDIGPARAILTNITGVDIYGAGSIHSNQPRPAGPFPAHHALGGYLLLTTLVAVALWLDPAQRVMRRRWLVVVIAFSAAAILQTVTISPIVTTLVGALILGAWYGRLWYVAVRLGAILLVGAVVFASILGARASDQFRSPTGSQASQTIVPQTLRYRWQIWTQQNLPAVEQQPLAGFGPVLPSGLAFPYAESLYFTFLFRGGLILLAVYLALMYAWFRLVKTRTQIEQPEQRAVARVLTYVLVALVGIHAIESYFVDTGPPHVLWALMAIAVASGPTARPRSPARPRA